MQSHKDAKASIEEEQTEDENLVDENLEGEAP